MAAAATAAVAGAQTPVFSALTSSTRQLHLLLRCVGFRPRAQVQISAEGIRVSVEDSRVMQGHAFLGKNLFTTYEFNPPNGRPSHDAAAHDTSMDLDSNQQDSGDDDNDTLVTFDISLYALLECLLIFGFDSKGGGGIDNKYGGSSSSGGPSLFLDQQILRMSGGTCKLVYMGHGYPLSLILSENNTTTTCDLVTYEASETYDDIPLQRDALAQKIIMKATWLYDAIQELDSNLSPEKLVIKASPTAPYFSLSSIGYMGSTIVEFSRNMLETFQVPELITNTYKFSFIKHASKAMAAATKVSIRGDNVGVLSLQFMIDTNSDGSGIAAPSFIDYRFLPFESDEDTSEPEMDEGV